MILKTIVFLKKLEIYVFINKKLLYVLLVEGFINSLKTPKLFEIFLSNIIVPEQP